MGTTYFWKSGATNFGLASSWSPTGGPPTLADTAAIDVAAAVSGTGAAQFLNFNSTGVTISSPLNTTVGINTTIGATAAGSVTVSAAWRLDTPALTVGAQFKGSLDIGAGGSVTDTVAGSFVNIGQDAGATGTLAISGGGKFSDRSTGDLLGNSAGASGVATVNGAGSNWTTTAIVTVGNLGDGTLTLSSGGSLDAADVTVGNNYNGAPGSTLTGTATIESGSSLMTTGSYDEIGGNVGATGTVTVDGSGSIWSAAAGTVDVGGQGSGFLTISNDGAVTALQVTVGDNYQGPTTGGGSGTALIESGGSLTTTGNFNAIGANVGGTGTVTVEGPGSKWTAAGGTIDDGSEGTGTLTVSDSGAITAVDVTVGDNYQGPTAGGASGTALIESGGALKTTGSYDQIGGNGGGTGTVTVDGLGSSWNAAGTILDGNLGAGSLTVSNKASVTALNVDVGNNYSGPTTNGASGTALIESGGSVTTTGPWDEIGANVGGTGAVTVTGAGSKWASGGAIEIGDGGNGSLTISDGASVTAVNEFDVGQQGNSSTNDGSSGDLLIESGGTAATGGYNTGSGLYDTVGLNAAGPTSTATVTGAGSSWTMSANLVVDTTGDVSAADGGVISVDDDIFVNQGSTLSVDSSSAITDDASAAQTGHLTVGPDAQGTASLAGDGTVDANVIADGSIFAGEGTLAIDGSISGTANLWIGAEATLALNGGTVSNAGGAWFLGWDGNLAIGDASGFGDAINNFIAGDTIDLTNVKFTSSSYSYTPGAGGGPADLQITENGVTYNLNVDPLGALSGALTVKADASGKGTEIVFTSPPASPFNLWSALPNFFSTSTGPVNGDDWASSSSAAGGQPIWVDTATPASSYALGSPGNYSIVMTSQDWLGTEQPLVTVATDTDIVNPFGTGPSSIGNLGGATIFTSNNATGNGAVFYWTNSTTAGDYAVKLQPITTTFVSAPSTGPNTVLSGSPVTLEAAVANPLYWTYALNSAGTGFVFSYAVAAGPSSELVYLQAFNASGLATSPLVELAFGKGAGYAISYNSSNGNYYFNYLIANDGASTGFYSESFNPSTGAVGAPSQTVQLPSTFTSLFNYSAHLLSNGQRVRFFDGIDNGQQVIQAYYGNGSPAASATFDLTGSTPDPFATTGVYDINGNAVDDTVLAYTDNNQVHLELLNELGQQVGSDYIVPGLTSFDAIHTLTGSFGNSDTRVEIDYTVTDPSGGTEVEGLIYDTVGAPDVYTLGAAGNNEYNGTPFNDTITDAPGTYTLNGGGGVDTFVVNDNSGQVQLSENSAGDVIVTTPGGVTTLQRFSTIQLGNAMVAINGNVLTQTNADGSKEVSTFNITGQAFTSKVISYAPNGQIVSKLYDGVTGEGNLSAFEYLYAGNDLVGADDFYTGITGRPYTAQEFDYDGAGRVIRVAFSDVAGEPYSAFEYDYVGGVFSGSKFTYTSVPSGASYSSYEVDYNQASAVAGEKFFFTNVAGQSYTGEEEDFDASGKLSRVALSGIENQAYSSLELDYSAGTYDGYKAYYDISGQSYTNEEVDVSASNQLEKVVYSGLTGTPYSSVEQDYSGGALADTIYGYADVTGQTYNAYQVDDDASGTALTETFDLNSGGHTLVALAGGQTLTSLGDDKMTGSSTGATTFVLNAVYGADTITNLTSADTVSMPSSEFASFNAMTAHAANSGSNVLITASDGDTLTLKNMSTTQLAAMTGNFTFHS